MQQFQFPQRCVSFFRKRLAGLLIASAWLLIRTTVMSTKPCPATQSKPKRLSIPDLSLLLRCPVVATVVSMMLASTMDADTIYTYVGNNFDTFNDSERVEGSYSASMSITGNFTLPAPLEPNIIFQQIFPTTFSFTDGRNTITHANQLQFPTTAFFVSTDAQGNIVSQWSIVVRTDPDFGTFYRGIDVINAPNAPIVTDVGSITLVGTGIDQAFNSDNPGTWTRVVLGDVNEDGLTNLLDVTPLVRVIVSHGFQPEADVNQDNAVNLLDVQPFVALLTGPAP